MDQKLFPVSGRRAVEVSLDGAKLQILELLPPRDEYQDRVFVTKVALVAACPMAVIGLVVTAGALKDLVASCFVVPFALGAFLRCAAGLGFVALWTAWFVGFVLFAQGILSRACVVLDLERGSYLFRYGMWRRSASVRRISDIRLRFHSARTREGLWGYRVRIAPGSMQGGLLTLLLPLPFGPTIMPQSRTQIESLAEARKFMTWLTENCGICKFEMVGWGAKPGDR